MTVVNPADSVYNMTGKKLVSVIIPCYNSEKSIGQVVEMTLAEFAKSDRYECEFVLVNDNSKDATFAKIRELAAAYPCVHGVNLFRNFGQHNGLMCAMRYAKGQVILGMDDDLQCQPSQIPAILGKLEEGFDLVYGVYREAPNGMVKNFTSWLNKVTARKLLGRPKDIRSSNFWAITEQLKEQVVRYTNYNPQLDALFTRLTTNVGNVEIESHERVYGSSGYSFSKMVKLWLAYFNYTVVPLRFISGVGVFTAALGFVAGIVTIVRKLLEPSMMAGWASTICVLLFFFGLVLLTLGIIGEYLGNIVLSVNSTPQYIVRETVNLDD